MDGHSFGEEFDWPTRATHAGAVGRFIWFLESSECEIDSTLKDMTGLSDFEGRQPASAFIDRIHAEDQSLVWFAANEALVTGNDYNAEFRFVRPNGKIIWLAAQGRVTDTPDGNKVILGVNYDISEQRNLLQRYEIVAGEMEHRVKNLLTIVGSVYRSSARGAETIEDLSEAFLPRLRALSALNELSARLGHQEIEIDALVEVVLQPVTGRKITRDIDGCYVDGRMGQTLTLMLNELMTNAIKYGGLASDGNGSVHLKILTDDDLLTLEWVEQADYPIKAPVSPSGFGMEVLNNMSAATYGGRPKFEWKEKGLTFSCTWPLSEATVD